MKQEVLKKIKQLKPGEPFLITITAFDKEKAGQLNTSVFSNKFPYGEFDGTKKIIGKLIDEQKEKGFKK